MFSEKYDQQLYIPHPIAIQNMRFERYNFFWYLTCPMKLDLNTSLKAYSVGRHQQFGLNYQRGVLTSTQASKLRCWKLRPTVRPSHLLTGVKCRAVRATCVAKKYIYHICVSIDFVFLTPYKKNVEDKYLEIRLKNQRNHFVVK